MRDFQIFTAITIFAIFFKTDITAQRLMNRIKQKAQNKVNQKADNAVDKAIDSATATKSKSATEPSTPKQPGNAVQEQKPITAYKNYDFVPGDKIIFQSQLSEGTGR